MNPPLNAIDPSDILHGRDPKILDLLVALGIPDPAACERVVIDLRADELARVYVQRFAVGLDPKAVAALGVKLEITEVGQ